MAKALYGALFDWIVDQVSSLVGESPFEDDNYNNNKTVCTVLYMTWN